MHFPTLDARTLSGMDKHLPTDLPAERTLVALAFQQRHQRDVDACMAGRDDCRLPHRIDVAAALVVGTPDPAASGAFLVAFAVSLGLSPPHWRSLPLEL